MTGSAKFVKSREETMAEALIRQRIQDVVKALNAKDPEERKSTRAQLP